MSRSKKPASVSSHDAAAALRGRSVHDDARGEMVLAESMGNEHCQTARQQESKGGIGALARGRHASHVGGWLGVSLDEGGEYGKGGDIAVSRKQGLEVRIQGSEQRRKTSIADDGDVSSWRRLFR